MQNENDKNYARAFASQSGVAVLAHLRQITIERWLGPAATEAELRSLEAQRALVHQIESLVNRGKEVK
jgi:hypothetical protein